MSQWKLVPVETTKEMIEAGLDGDLNPSSIYAAMIAAAPEPTLHMLESAWGDQSGGFAAAAAPPTNLSDARDATLLADLLDWFVEPTPETQDRKKFTALLIERLRAALAAQGGTSK